MDNRSQPTLAIAIRPIRRTDATGLADFYARLTPESRRRRFLGGTMPATDLVSALAKEPGMVAVLRESGACEGKIVAHASVQLDGHHGAEVAFAVADELRVTAWDAGS